MKFQSNRGCKDALLKVDAYLKEGYTHAVDADFKGYFDSIRHDLLKTRIQAHIQKIKGIQLPNIYSITKLITVLHIKSSVRQPNTP
jgi:retron-type reverse transcriptase